MFLFWFIPVLILAIVAVIWFSRRAATTSPAQSDSDLRTTDRAEQQERNQGLR
jgi:hypothetical protein